MWPSPWLVLTDRISGGYKAQKAYHKPAAPYVKGKTYESSYVPQKKAYNVPSYDMAGYPSESSIYKKQYNKAHQPSYLKKASNYGAHHGSTYQQKVKDYPRY